MNPYKVGDSVFVKPANARCFTPWGEGKVTGIIANTVVEVNSRNRHISDVRRVPMEPLREATTREYHSRPVELVADVGEVNEDVDENPDLPGDEQHDERPVRDRAPPRWLADFLVD